MWKFPKGFPKGVGWVGGGFMAFHTLSIPWPALERAQNLIPSSHRTSSGVCCFSIEVRVEDSPWERRANQTERC
jgi:hypothetical protein